MKVSNVKHLRGNRVFLLQEITENQKEVLNDEIRVFPNLKELATIIGISYFTIRDKFQEMEDDSEWLFFKKFKIKKAIVETKEK